MGHAISARPGLTLSLRAQPAVGRRGESLGGRRGALREAAGLGRHPDPFLYMGLSTGLWRCPELFLLSTFAVVFHTASHSPRHSLSSLALPSAWLPLHFPGNKTPVYPHREAHHDSTWSALSASLVVEGSMSVGGWF